MRIVELSMSGSGVPDFVDILAEDSFVKEFWNELEELSKDNENFALGPILRYGFYVYSIPKPSNGWGIENVIGEMTFLRDEMYIYLSQKYTESPETLEYANPKFSSERIFKILKFNCELSI